MNTIHVKDLADLKVGADGKISGAFLGVQAHVAGVKVEGGNDFTYNPLHKDGYPRLALKGSSPPAGTSENTPVKVSGIDPTFHGKIEGLYQIIDAKNGIDSGVIDGTILQDQPINEDGKVLSSQLFFLPYEMKTLNGVNFGQSNDQFALYLKGETSDMARYISFGHLDGKPTLAGRVDTMTPISLLSGNPFLPEVSGRDVVFAPAEVDFSLSMVTHPSGRTAPNLDIHPWTDLSYANLYNGNVHIAFMDGQWKGSAKSVDGKGSYLMTATLNRFGLPPTYILITDDNNLIADSKPIQAPSLKELTPDLDKAFDKARFRVKN